MRDNKSCKTCRFLHTDSFISPCAHCENENHWGYDHWVEVDKSLHTIGELIKQILEHVFPREQAIVKAQLDRLIAEVKGEKNDDT